ncbi:glycine betaine/L-proline ABC transporter permease ProW [Pseudorhodoferax sp. Leaf267]|uniref:glycine betaine/L-proline ABC transporter permease ProW n=1 Tax=Pseudorhodoferax sp. Leaf267 TaxID=1736316 RepID=UPI0006FB2769|nr:glycine betaine/L-proline ABC transporter permease ProW [Pseudorhodoferax sp. Leaf267]KQP18318.1 ABC transporter permease [Pseudorhodoferax sp. Leaf267]
MQDHNTTTSIAQADANPWDAAGTPAAPVETPAADPWASPQPAPEAGSAWGGSEPAAGADDWLDAPATALDGADAAGFHFSQLWDGSLPVESWINQGLAWTVEHFRPFFQTVRAPIDTTLASVEALLLSVPTLAMVALLGLIAWQCAGRAIALGGVVSLLLIAMLGIWPEAMTTLSLVLTSLVFCLVIGLPLGILLAASDRANRIMRPLLDAMQTTPAFVYLVPVVMLFGIGNVPGVIVTIVFALPPLVRLTTLGIRQVRPDLIEAARSYGASPWQLLTKVQLPLAMPSIMAGINQALMLSLSMVVIASMIAVGGLGQMVLRGIGRLDMGLATVGGLGIVLLAITLDRITQAMGQPRRGARHWWQTGPAGLVLRALRPAPAKPAPAVHEPESAELALAARIH